MRPGPVLGLVPFDLAFHVDLVPHQKLDDGIAVVRAVKQKNGANGNTIGGVECANANNNNNNNNNNETETTNACKNNSLRNTSPRKRCASIRGFVRMPGNLPQHGTARPYRLQNTTQHAPVQLDLFQPLLQVVKGIHACDVVYQNNTVGAPVIRARERSEAFLAGRVPDGELDPFPAHVQVLDLEIDTDGRLDVFVEGIVRETEQHRGLFAFIVLCCVVCLFVKPNHDARCQQQNQV